MFVRDVLLSSREDQTSFVNLLDERQGLFEIIGRVLKFLVGQGATSFSNRLDEWEVFLVTSRRILKPPPHQAVT